MTDNDRPAFHDLLVEAALVYGEELSPERLHAYWRVLAPRVRIADLRWAMDTHLADPERGRFFPRPADLMGALARLRDGDGQLVADEAWALALRASDEAETVVWTPEIA